jgi:hypothetical protein
MLQRPSLLPPLRHIRVPALAKPALAILQSACAASCASQALISRQAVAALAASPRRTRIATVPRNVKAGAPKDGLDTSDIYCSILHNKGEVINFPGRTCVQAVGLGSRCDGDTVCVPGFTPAATCLLGAV